MSTQALALSVEEESPSQNLTEDAGTTVNATITVDIESSNIDLHLDTNSPGVTVAGTNVILEPTSSTLTPVTYNLTFKAGKGISSFATPAAEIQVSTAEAIAIAMNPTTATTFVMSFVNNLAITDNARAYSFDILYVPTGLEAKVRLKDPTILLDPPNN